MIVTVEFLPTYDIGRQEIFVEYASLLTIVMLFDEKKYPYSVYLRGCTCMPSEFGWSDQGFPYWCKHDENIFTKNYEDKLIYNFMVEYLAILDKELNECNFVDAIDELNGKYIYSEYIRGNIRNRFCTIEHEPSITIS